MSSGRNGMLEGLGIGEVESMPDDGAGLIWLDVDDPNEADLERVGREFGLHPLAIEDAVRRHERPKIDIYQDSIFIVFYSVELIDEHPRTREISMFAGQHFLITVHEGYLDVIEETAKRWNDAVLKQTAAPSIGLMVYSLLDSIVDGYFPVVDELAERVDELETGIFDGESTATHEALFTLKKDLLAMRRVVAPERDVMNMLVRRDAPLFSREEVTYFQDVYEHLLRVTDSLDTYRD
ncbi:MAG: magnesium transporter CorA family protein, partial [Thermomicrobiales bacterium]